MPLRGFNPVPQAAIFSLQRYFVVLTILHLLQEGDRASLLAYEPLAMPTQSAAAACHNRPPAQRSRGHSLRRLPFLDCVQDLFPRQLEPGDKFIGEHHAGAPIPLKDSFRPIELLLENAVDPCH